MSTLGTTRLTLFDIANRLDPNGKIAKIAETLNEFNAIIDDISFMEGNLPTGHKVTIRASLPVPTWRLLNKGVASTKSKTRQIVETCGIMEAYSTLDKDEAQLNGNTSETRASEDIAHIEGMNQEFAQTLIYGDTSVNPQEFVGLAPRYYSISEGTCYGNVIDGEGTGTANTSVWLVGWSPATVTGIYPKGSTAGLQVNDLGEQTVLDSDSNPFQAYRTHFQWKCGLSVKDWRYVVRIANLDIAALETAGDTSDTSTNLLKHMAIALSKIPPNGMVNPVFYCNQRVIAMLIVKLMNKSNTYLTMKDWASPIPGLLRQTLTFMGVPVRRIDQITNTESALT